MGDIMNGNMLIIIKQSFYKDMIQEATKKMDVLPQNIAPQIKIERHKILDYIISKVEKESTNRHQ